MLRGFLVRSGNRVTVCTCNMAACELKGELKYRDGQTNQFTVQVDGNLKSMITGIKKLNADISEVLTALVEQERGSAENSTADVDEEEEEDSDEEDSTSEMATKKSNSEPPNKRIKTLRS
uniref:Si:dkeyp-55f12.3 n=1 Tax=Sinocyclocheilus rhinocerous TaxID=307959 RepID=A0A673K2J5_9TELE